MGRAAGKKRLSNAAIGAIAFAVVAVLSYFAFAGTFGQGLPWGGGTEYRVAFNSAQNLRLNSPVRIAGVEVGKVTGVEPLAAEDSEELSAEGAAGDPTDPGSAGGMVTLELSDDGLPLKEDATFRLRPRLFLEGNLFVDLRPGSPGSPEVDAGHVFSPAQTSNSVQLDQILTGSLQKDTRRDLQVLLDEFGKALIEGEGAKSFRILYRTSKPNFKNTSQVSEALLGENPHDLSNLISNLERVVSGLGRNEQALQDTVTNLRIVTGSLAAESGALEQAVIELPQVLDAADPAFANLNAAFPPLRAFAREALPGVRSTPETLDVATPFVRQLRLLSRPEELRGLARDLRPAARRLAQLAKRTPLFLEEARALASCFNQVIIPWADDEVEGPEDYPFPATGRVFEETGYGLAGIAGESRSGDANGQYIRIAGGGGTNTVSVTAANGEQLAGVTQFPIQGTMPPTDSSAKTPFMPAVPCETQEPPDLRGGAAGAPPSQTSAEPSAVPTKGKAARIVADSTDALKGLAEAAALHQDGERAEARALRLDALEDLRRFYAKHRGSR